MADPYGGTMDFPGPAGFSRIAAPLLSFLFFLSILFLPLFGWILNFLAPLPLVYYFFTHGRKSAQVAVLGMTALISAIFGMQLGFLYLLSYGLLALVLAEMILRRAAIGSAVVAAAAISAATTVAFFWLISSMPVSEFHADMVDEVQTMIAATVSNYEKAGISQDQVDFMDQNTEWIAKWLVNLLPATASIAYLMLALGNYLVYKRLQNRWSFLPVPDQNPITVWTPPDKMVFVIIAAGGMALFPGEIIRPAGVNLLMLLGTIYSLAGIGIIHFFMLKYNLPIFIRWAVYILISLQPFLLFGVAGLGLFDLWFDFRKLRVEDGEGMEE